MARFKLKDEIGDGPLVSDLIHLQNGTTISVTPDAPAGRVITTTDDALIAGLRMSGRYDEANASDAAPGPIVASEPSPVPDTLPRPEGESDHHTTAGSGGEEIRS